MAPKIAMAGRARRRLRRNTSAALLPVETKSVVCIRGAVRKHWMVLPVHDIGGTTSCLISGRTRWLYQMLCGHNGPKVYRGAVRNFLEESLRIFRSTRAEPAEGRGLEPSAQGSEPTGQRAEQANPPAPPKPPPERKGRAAVMSDSDSEGGGAMEKPGGLAAKNVRVSGVRGKPRRGDWVTISIRGFALQLTVVRGPRLAIPVEGPWLQRVISDLHPRAHEASSQGEKASLGLEETDRGRIRWRGESATNSASWVVTYSDGQGRMRDFRAGLTVKGHGVTGERLTLDAFRANAKRLLATARAHWNRLDCSGAERYDTTT